MFSTDRRVNINQLGVELGRVPAKWVGPDDDGVVTMTPLDGAVLTEKQWESAIEVHVPDENWVDPEYVPPSPPSAAEKLASVGLTPDELLALVEEAQAAKTAGR